MIDPETARLFYWIFRQVYKKNRNIRTNPFRGTGDNGFYTLTSTAGPKF